MSDKEKDKRTHDEKLAVIIKEIIASAIISSTVFILSYLYLPINTSGLKELPDRLTLTISCLFVSSFAIHLGIFGVFRFRAFTNAIDPVYGKSENLVFFRTRYWETQLSSSFCTWWPCWLWLCSYRAALWKLFQFCVAFFWSLGLCFRLDIRLLLWKERMDLRVRSYQQ